VFNLKRNNSNLEDVYGQKKFELKDGLKHVRANSMNIETTYAAPKQRSLKILAPLSFSTKATEKMKELSPLTANMNIVLVNSYNEIQSKSKSL